MSRLYNDYGSMARAEANVDCANFAEFYIDKMESEDTEEKEVKLKKKVLKLPEYERGAVNRTGERLIEALERSGRGREEKIAGAVRIFMATAVLFAEDLSNPSRHT